MEGARWEGTEGMDSGGVEWSGVEWSPVESNQIGRTNNERQPRVQQKTKHTSKRLQHPTKQPPYFVNTLGTAAVRKLRLTRSFIFQAFRKTKNEVVVRVSGFHTKTKLSHVMTQGHGLRWTSSSGTHGTASKKVLRARIGVTDGGLTRHNR